MEVGKRSVVYGNVPSNLKVGEDCVVIGPTDNNGRVRLTGTMAVGSGARAGRDSIAFGFGAGSAIESPSLEEVRAILSKLTALADEQKNADDLLAIQQLKGELDKERPDPSALKKLWTVVEKFAAGVGAYDGAHRICTFLSMFPVS